MTLESDELRFCVSEQNTLLSSFDNDIRRLYRDGIEEEIPSISRISLDSVMDSNDIISQMKSAKEYVCPHAPGTQLCGKEEISFYLSV